MGQTNPVTMLSGEPDNWENNQQWSRMDYQSHGRANGSLNWPCQACYFFLYAKSVAAESVNTLYVPY